jgi:hypothetical protein
MIYLIWGWFFLWRGPGGSSARRLARGNRLDLRGRTRPCRWAAHARAHEAWRSSGCKRSRHNLGWQTRGECYATVKCVALGELGGCNQAPLMDAKDFGVSAKDLILFFSQPDLSFCLQRVLMMHAASGRSPTHGAIFYLFPSSSLLWLDL